MSTHIHIPRDPSEFRLDSAFWFLWNLTGHRDTGRGKTRLASSSFSPPGERKCFNHVSFTRKFAIEEILGVRSPPGYEISDLEIFFRLF